ncbi:MAG: hypothetical protein BWY89_01568 [Bacteroidetes bacterium ADurb.BinA012]|nr:MAG: hypothetical protein BWY89_01568 [Bacteroidetes bacterium ADurb.BinA012]
MPVFLLPPAARAPSVAISASSGRFPISSLSAFPSGNCLSVRSTLTKVAVSFPKLSLSLRVTRLEPLSGEKTKVNVESVKVCCSVLISESGLTTSISSREFASAMRPMLTGSAELTFTRVSERSLR